MGEENKVILHGMWVSPYAERVELALKLKGICYESVEEDTKNKSPLLLKYNPVHKKVPVFVHNGKPVCESSIILEYIDETWKNEPRFFPEGAYERAQVRFWASYIQQMIECVFKIFLKGDKQETMKECYEKMSVLEDGIKNSSLGISTSLEGRNMTVLDIMVGVTFRNYKTFDEVFGVKIVDPEKTPLFYSWVTALNELPIVKQTIIPQDKLALFLKSF